MRVALFTKKKDDSAPIAITDSDGFGNGKWQELVEALRQLDLPDCGVNFAVIVSPEDGKIFFEISAEGAKPGGVAVLRAETISANSSIDSGDVCRKVKQSLSGFARKEMEKTRLAIESWSGVLERLQPAF